MQLPSETMNAAVAAFSRLPGIGKKTALRLVLYLLKADGQEVEAMAQNLLRLKTELKQCKTCFNVSDTEICSICANPSRDKSIICVVEDLKDLLAVEQTGHFRGTYHVLGGLVSPIDGIGPEHLHIQPLMERVHAGGVEEIIFALSANMEGDTTSFYIARQLAAVQVRCSTLSRGISVGGALEFADELTLVRSLSGRVPYNL